MNDASIHNVREFIIDAFECQQELSNSKVAKNSIDTLRCAANSSGATVIDIHFTEYTIHGFTTVALLAESHIILTTWPELNYASINVYLCNKNMDPKPAIDCIINYLKPSSYRSTWVRHLSLPKRENRIFLSAPFTPYLNEGIFDKKAFNQISFLITLFKKHGFSVFSAHEREGYGKHLMGPSECTLSDFKEMTQCDIVVALIDDNSYGVSLELGWASALRKPIILYKEGIQNFATPLIEGIGELTDSKVVSDYKSLLFEVQELKCKREIILTK